MTEISKDDIQSLYASLMAEVKARLMSVSQETARFSSLTDNVQKTFVVEYCYLQLRRVTELIALGVLVTHNILEDFRKADLLKNWNADDLLSKMSKINADAFPIPATFVEFNDTIVMQFTVSDKPTFELRDEVRKIYRECSDKLHTGHLRAVLKQRSKPYDMGFVRNSSEKLAGLLENHVIVLPDKRALRAMLSLKSSAHVRCQWIDPATPQQGACDIGNVAST